MADKQKELEEKIQRSLRKLRVMYPNLSKNLNDYQFQQSIGKGGFGEVNLAKNVKDGKMYAVKQLFEKRLVGNNFRRFLDEIKTMAKCVNQFLLPIAGFTYNPPYAIITPYMPSGCLKDYISKRSEVKLSPTQLTKIAMGIAHGMITVHENNIIHRDLKVANILMDENLLPKICDFGIARFESLGEENLMTAGIGTQIYMAPELFLTRSYSNKVDVYSFAFILWEMSEKKRAFQNMNIEKLNERVFQKGERESFSMNTPRALQSLIKKCWDPDPAKRPSFTNIYNAFASGKVSFLGTDEDAIKRFAQEVEETHKRTVAEQLKRNEAAKRRVEEHVKKVQNMREREKEKEKNLIELSKKSEERKTPPNQFQYPQQSTFTVPENNTPFSPHVNQPSYQQQSVFYSPPSSNEDNTTTDPVQVLKNYKNVNFEQFLKGYSVSIGLEHFNFFANVFINFTKRPPVSVIKFIVQCCNKVMEKNAEFVTLFGNSQYYLLLPIANDDAVDEIVESFKYLFINAPQIAIQNALIPQLRLLLDLRAEKMLILYSFAVKRITKVSFTNEHLQMLFQFAPRVRDAPYGYMIIRVLFYIAAYDTACKPFIKANCESLFVSLLGSSDRMTVISAYNTLLNLFESVDGLDYNVLIRHLKDEYFVNNVVSLLLRARSIPRMSELAGELMRIGLKIPRAWIIMYQMASNMPDNFPLIGAFWSENLKTQFENVLKLFFILFHHHPNRDRFLQSQWYLEMCIMMSKSQNEFYMTVIPSLFTRQTISTSLLEQLINGGFWHDYIQFALDKNTTQLNNNILVLLYNFAQKAGYTDEFAMFTQRLIQLLADPVLFENAMKTIATLSHYPKFMAVFPHDEASYNYFVSLADYPGVAQTAKMVVENMYKFIQQSYQRQ